MATQAQREEAVADEEDVECVVHAWSEWLKDEWIANL